MTKKGYKQSEEHKLKISKAMQGINNPNYGRKHTEESKEKMRNKKIGKIPWNKGIPCSVETKKKISKSNKDKYPSEILKRKRANPRIGLKRSMETKEKMSLSGRMRIVSDDTKDKLRKPKSEEHKKKLSENHADVCGKNNPMYGKLTHGHGIYYNSPLQGKIWLRSSYELAYVQYLDSKKILWYYEIETFELSDEMTYTPDFFLPQFEKFIEIKGYMRKRDEIKIKQFLEQYPWDLEILYKEDLIKLGCEL